MQLMYKRVYSFGNVKKSEVWRKHPTCKKLKGIILQVKDGSELPIFLHNFTGRLWEMGNCGNFQKMEKMEISGNNGNSFHFWEFVGGRELPHVNEIKFSPQYYMCIKYSVEIYNIISIRYNTYWYWYYITKRKIYVDMYIDMVYNKHIEWNKIIWKEQNYGR